MGFCKCAAICWIHLYNYRFFSLSLAVIHDTESFRMGKYIPGDECWPNSDDDLFPFGHSSRARSSARSRKIAHGRIEISLVSNKTGC